LPNAEWRVLIADDEPAARLGVRQLLAAFPAFEVAGECRDGAEVLQSLDRLRPDVVFLDIQMPGLSGFDVIRRRTPERMPAVVFLTAYDQFALHAFDAQALDYLVKPVTEARFASTMKRLTRQLQGGAGSEKVRAIVVSTTRGTLVVPLREVDWIEAADNYARIWTGGRSYLLRESLGTLEERIGANGFVRAHRRALVRLDAVQRLVTTDDGDCVAVLTNHARIPVSRRRRAAFAAAVKARGVNGPNDAS
jgi:two-component system, LytTR family, response regulator